MMNQNLQPNNRGVVSQKGISLVRKMLTGDTLDVAESWAFKSMAFSRNRIFLGYSGLGAEFFSKFVGRAENFTWPRFAYPKQFEVHGVGLLNMIREGLLQAKLNFEQGLEGLVLLPLSGVRIQHQQFDKIVAALETITAVPSEVWGNLEEARLSRLKAGPGRLEEINDGPDLIWQRVLYAQIVIDGLGSSYNFIHGLTEQDIFDVLETMAFQDRDKFVEAVRLASCGLSLSGSDASYLSRENLMGAASHLSGVARLISA